MKTYKATVDIEFQADSDYEAGMMARELNGSDLGFGVRIVGVSVDLNREGFCVAR